MSDVLAQRVCDDGSKFPAPRPFQLSAHEQLRAGFKAGHKNQLIMAPTGAGKTYLGLRICNEAMQKGKRAVFLCDRTTLINQTSEAADGYGLNQHGVIQANHWRRRPEELLQIASAQTIAKREYWPQLDVLVVDECHSQLKVWTEYAMASKAAVIGLSATPFSTGLGKIFSNLINATTMHQLTESGVLVPMRIFSCTKPDMRGAATAGGEWTDKAAEERGMDIVGDVVSEWMKFAEGRKTIVFGATIKHCKELAQQFINNGVMAAVFTSETTAKERETLLDEYRKPNGYLRVLISVEALAKGFDCIAEGSKVLTNRGLVAIEEILLSDKIWDGHEFVSHGGVIFKGERDVITYQGLTATEDHLVKTPIGWRSFGECKRLDIPIVVTGDGRKKVWESSGYFSGGSSQENYSGLVSKGKLQMRAMWSSFVDAFTNLTGWGKVQSLLGRQPCASVGRQQNQKHEGPVQQFGQQGVSKLWWSRDSVQLHFGTRSGQLDCDEFGFTATGSKHTIGSHQQRRSLRAWQYSLGKQISKLFQHAKRWVGGKDAPNALRASRNQVLGQNAEESVFVWPDARSSHRKILSDVGQAKGRVWDILNCGPRNSFTCEGLLVHNCPDVGCVCDARPLRKSLSTAIQMWGRGLRSSPATGKKDCILLDFSGNIVRFAEDFTDVFFNGLEKLDDGDKLDKTIRKDDEVELKGCPRCGYKPFHKRCMACGYEKIEPALKEALPGHMQEITIGEGKNKKKLADNAEHLWHQVVAYAKHHSQPEKQSARAWHLYKKITGQETQWAFSTAPIVEIGRNVHQKIQQLNIAYTRGKKI